MTKQTSALRNTTAGYWAIAYRVIHAKYAAERTYDACVFTILPHVTSACVSHCRTIIGLIVVSFCLYKFGGGYCLMQMINFAWGQTYWMDIYPQVAEAGGDGGCVPLKNFSVGHPP